MSDDKTEEIKRNILSPAAWMRILYMVFYAVACWVLLFVLPVVIVCQVIISLITGIDNRNLRDFGSALSDYFHQAMNYLVYATDEKPWPFSDGEDLGESFDDDEDDEDEDEPVDDGESPPRPQAQASAGGDDDVFSDITFTGDEDQAATEDDNGPEDTDDNNNEKKDPV